MKASEFRPRLKIPTYGDKYYNTKNSGGWNPCILGNNSSGQRVKGLNVLPNCVGYSVGRFNEIGGLPECKYLGNRNPDDLLKLAKLQGLKITKTPVLGGAMIWTNGLTNSHIANVEAVIDDYIVTSESEWYGSAFRTYTRRIGADGNWRIGCGWMSAKWHYEGCIVNPFVEEEEVFTYDKFKEYMALYNDELARNDKTWAGNAIKEVEELGIMQGDERGFRPNSLVTRAELAQVSVNIVNKK